MLEITIYRDSRKVYETIEVPTSYNEYGRKVYGDLSIATTEITTSPVICNSIPMLPLLAKTVIEPSFSIFTQAFGFNPTVLCLAGAITLVILAVLYTLKKSEGTVWENVLWLLVALSPALYLMFVCLGVC